MRKRLALLFVLALAVAAVGQLATIAPAHATFAKCIGGGGYVSSWNDGGGSWTHYCHGGTKSGWSWTNSTPAPADEVDQVIAPYYTGDVQHHGNTVAIVPWIVHACATGGPGCDVA